MVVWYLQPHIPFVTAEWSEGYQRNNFGDADAFDRSVWDLLREGDLTYQEVWGSYWENLEYVLDDVELLLENLDVERPVISSDHANGFGEWGIYGHPRYIPAPSLKRVPWATAEATDKGTLAPDIPTEADVDQADVEERLRNLGYR